MNNRRNLKENLTISNKQRFSIRKFSIGVASVMLGTTLYFMGGVGTSIVHADSVQGQSVQTSNLDTNSAQASSDTSSAEQTSSQNQTSSAQNSQKAVSNASSNTESTDSKTQTSDQVDNATTDKNEASQADNATTDKNEASQADNASATNIKTRDNKKVVSDANRAKSTANDTQTKPAQQTAKSDAANSNTLVVQRTKKLTVNAKLLADSKAQTDTKTDSNYSVTDNYPEGLMNYLPRDFNNTQEYAFEWLRNERKNNIILTTNRTGDGVVHVYQDGKEVDTLARNSLYPLHLYDNIWGDEIGTVYNDDYAGIVQSNGLNIIYSSHAKDVDNAGSSYSTVSFFVPHKITQTVTYKDSDGKVIKGLTHTQDGLTGQSYTTGLPSGSDYVRKGEKGEVEYLDNITNNSSGLISEFHDGYTCTKDYHDGVSVTFTEKDSDGIGAMDYVIYDGGWVAQWGSLAYGQSTNYTNGSGRYTIVNPYVPQTTNIVYQYKKLGQVITTDPSGNKTRVYYTVYYTNDQSDPIKSEPVNAKPITGYSAIVKYENKIVSDKNFMPTNLGENTYITYSANAQKASVTYVDDKTGKTLKVDNLKGVTNAKSGYTTKAAIDTYTGLGYTLVSDDTNGKEVVFDNDDAVDQAFTVHLSHGTITVTTENPGKPGEPVDPDNPDGPKYPDGTDKAGLTDTVNRTITYVMSDGSKAPDAVHDSLSYTASKVIDKVTGEVISTEWSKNQDFKDVVSPDVTGYTPDVKTVSNKNVAHDAKDIDVVVTYKAHAQKASVTYVDDKTGKTLKVDNLKGVTNAKSGYTTKAAIDTYTGLGYTLVSDDTNGKEVVFDNDDAVDQAFTVHLSHGTITVTTENPGKPGEPVDPDNPDGPKYPDGTDKAGLTDTVNRTITYVMSDGSKAPDAVHDSLSYTASKVIDKVTGEVISTEWSKNQDFKDVVSPDVTGYTPDVKTVSNKNVAHDAKDIDVVVTYKAHAQKASVTYVDDKTGKTLKVDNLKGVTNAKSGYTTKAAIDTYTGLGYTLVSDDTNGKEVVFDNDDAVDQAFTVHLSHGTITVTTENPGKPGEPVDPDNPDGPKYPDGTDKAGLTDTVNRTITYVMSDGSKAPDAVHDSLSYTASKVIDKVTGEVISTEWSKNQDFKDVVSPDVTGYTPDVKTVSNKNVAHDAKDIDVVVTYKAHAQKASVTYVDDKTGKTLKVDNLKGVTNAKSGYTTKAAIDTYTGLGYTLVSDDTNGKEVVFDNDDAVDQAFTVHLSHGTITVTTENPGKPGEPVDPDNPDGPKYPDGTDKAGLTDTVNRTITYVMSDGSKAPDAVHDSLSYTASKVIDKVTGEVISTEWSKNQDFKDVVSPDVTGYTPDVKTVSNKNVAHDAKDIDVVVTYKAHAQKASVTYVDDKTGKTLKVDNLKGVTNAKSGYTTKAAIDTYTGLGYTLVSDDTNGKEVVFDNDDAVDQAFTVHLSHGTITVTTENPGKPGEPVDPDNPDGPKYPDGTDKAGLTDTVNRTITYVMSDGSKAPDAVHDSLSYTASKVIDKVTGEVISTEWSKNQDFKDVVSPDVTGYTPDVKTVSNKNVAHDAKDIDVVVTYKAHAQKASVTYVDDKTGKTLKVDNLKGVTNAKSGYTTKAAIDTYTGLGYTLVSDDTNGKEVVFDNDDAVDQAFTVHLSHGTITVTTENPGKPGEPVDPDNPDGPKYPDGTDKAGLTDTVNRTITYVMSDGSKAPDAVHDSLSYTASKVIDKVTGEVISTEWSKNQDFKDVVSPDVTGYTPDVKTVSNKNVAHDAKDIDVVVTYKAHAQKASVTYVDDKTGKTLKVDNLKGVTNAKSGYTTKAAIDTYTGLGYTLVSDDTNGKEVVFDNDDAVDQAFTVHLSHGTITVTTENPGKPGEPVDPDNPDGPKYPDGTDKAGLTDTVNRTITYVMSDGSKAPDAVHDSLSYTASKVIDKVTGEVISTEWSKNQDFKDVVSPDVTGYTPDVKTVSNKNVAHDAKDIDVVVTYKAHAQKASVTYVDDKTGKTLKVDNLKGVTNAKSGYTTKAAIDTYTGLGYTLVSDDTNGKEVVFDNDDAVDQAFTVHLSHGTITVTTENPGKPGEPVDPDNPDGPKYPDGTDKAGLTDTVNRTITYVMSDGSKAPDAVHDSLSYTASKVIDKVTGEVISTEWSKNQDFKDVVSPDVTGYTPDVKTVSNKNVAHDAKDIDVVVTYKAHAQKASVTYVDDKTGKTLKVDNLKGVTNAKSGYTTKAAIDTYTGLGYTLVSDDTNGKEVVFDNDDAVDQAFTVHLSHGTITVTTENPGKPGEPVDPDNPDGPKYPDGTDKAGLTDTVNRTITYVMSDGSKAPDAVHDSLSYTASKVIDKVTGEVISTEWSKNQDFKDVVSPDVTGYTPDVKTVSNKNVAHDAKDIDVVVTYKAHAQKASVTYVDDKTGKTLKVDNLKGVTNAKSGYTTKAAIDTYTGLGYTLVSDDTNGKEVVFDNDDAVDQAFTVHLSHGTITVTTENPGKPGEPVDPDNPDGPKYPDGTDKAGLTDTVNRTITYVMSDGSKAPDAVHDSLSYTASKVIDKVTGEVISTEWSKNQDFKDVVSPDVTGYTPDVKTVSNKNVAHDAKDIDVVVTYKAHAQKASVTYVDDKTGKTLKVDNLKGVTNAKSGYTTKAAIDTYTGLGYTLVSDDTNGKEVVFDNDDAVDQAFTVHLSHGTITVTTENPGKPGEPVDPDNPDGPKYPDGTDKAGLTDTVNRTITYVMSDGSKAPDAVHDSLSYTASKVIDKVTGEVISTEWSKNQDFKDVVSPDVTGYTPDVKTVSNKNVAHDAKDIDVVVTYKAHAQKASVTYVDDKTGKTLKVDNLKGVTNAKSGYTTKAAIDTYTGLGYTLVSDDTNGKEVVFDNDDAVDQAFTVHLSHGTITVTTENPGKPGEPVDPDNPDGPKYPDGTDEYQVKRTGTQTIHYVGAGDKTPADNKQTFVFTREITFDEVTGKIISVTPWNVQSHTFGNVDTPVIPGYHADKAVAGGATVTPDDLNKVITVTYAPDGGSGDNPGSNGGGDQGTTPTPDDQPDTTLPSDNNTDKDVEKDKQDKPKKVKKARKIIKTRITKQEHIGNAEKAEPLAEQEHNDQTVASPVKNEANEPQLPQTGEANTSVIGLLGMLVAGFAAILGFESSRSRKHKN